MNRIVEVRWPVYEPRRPRRNVVANIVGAPHVFGPKGPDSGPQHVRGPVHLDDEFDRRTRPTRSDFDVELVIAKNITAVLIGAFQGQSKMRMQ